MGLKQDEKSSSSGGLNRIDTDKFEEDNTYHEYLNESEKSEMIPKEDIDITDRGDVGVEYGNGKIRHDEEDAPTVEVEMQTIRPLSYRVSETPPPHLLLLFSLQQALLAIGAPLSVSLIVAEVVCAQDDDIAKMQILSASMLMCGVATFAMSTFGLRLPIFQGPTTTYLIPLLAMSASPEFQCPATFKGTSDEDNSTILYAMVGNDSYVPAREIIYSKISNLSGSLMLVGVFHFLIGFTGIVGIIIRYVGPITIVPTIVLVGLYIYPAIVKFAEPSWGVASFTAITNLILSLFLAKKQTPIPMWNSEKGFHIFWYPLHRVFSVLLSMFLGWGLSGILTAAGAFTDDPSSLQFKARTDAKGSIIADAPFFDLPYPGKFGSYSFSTAGFLSFLVATLLSVLDSIGDYAASARTSRVPRPPRFAFNRGIAVEGIASLLSGSLGCCHATVSYGGNIGAMGITGVVSRRVFQLCGLIYIISAVVGKIGAFFVTIPVPVLGGCSLVIIGIFIGVVLSYLESVDLRSTRNLAIIGMALLLGMVTPYWIKKNPDGIQTGSSQMDTFIRILLSNPSFVAGFFACVMDNTVPGTLKERGLLEQLKEIDGDEENEGDPEKQISLQYEEGLEVYRLPLIPTALRQSRLAKIFPIFDTIANK